MACRRGLHQSERRVAVRVPGGRPAWAGHRRVGLGPPQRRRGPAVLPTRTGHTEGQAHQGGYRRRPGLPRRARRTDPVRVAPRRAPCQQPDRSRSQPTQTPATTDARTAYRPDRTDDHRRARQSRTCAADTTNLPSILCLLCWSPQRSPNSHKRSDRGPHAGSTRPPIPQCIGAPTLVWSMTPERCPSPWSWRRCDASFERTPSAFLPRGRLSGKLLGSARPEPHLVAWYRRLLRLHAPAANLPCSRIRCLGDGRR